MYRRSLLLPLHLVVLLGLTLASHPALGNADEVRGLGFSAGVGLEHYRKPFIRSARMVGEHRTVLVDDSFDQQASLWLQLNYVWNAKGNGRLFKHEYGAPGFYVGARAAGPESDGLDAFSLGVLWAFTRKPKNQGPDQAGALRPSINIGFGPVWHRTRQLASGIVPGQPLPAQFQQLEFERRDEVSWMLMVSFGFR